MTDRRERLHDKAPPLPMLPRLALRLFASPGERRTLLSELDELYVTKLHNEGDDAAHGWFKRQTRHFVTQLPIDWVFGIGSRGLGSPTPGRGMRGNWMVGVIRDLRHSVRALAKAPIFTLTIVSTVGLGVGGTTAVFAMVNAVLIEPLPYDSSERLWRIYTASGDNRWPFSVADYLALRDEQTSFDMLAAYQNRSLTLSLIDRSERVPARMITPGYFRLLGVTPMMGRLLTEADGQPGAPRATLVSHGFWQRYLGGKADAVGQVVKLNGVEYAVVGVIPAPLGPLDAGRDVFPAMQLERPSRKGPFFLTPLARLKSSVDQTTATAELHGINRRLFPLWQDSYTDSESTWRMVSLKEFVIGDVETALIVALGSVVFVLLIASTNTASLLVARTAGRRSELSVRSALGASRRDLVHLLASESVLLAGMGAVLGLAVLAGAIQLLTFFGQDFVPRTSEIGFSPTILGFFGAAVLGSLLLFGTIPLVGRHTSLSGSGLPTSGLRSTAGKRESRLRRILVGLQFAVSVPLLAGAGLLVVSLARLSRVDVGFDTNNILTAGISLPTGDYAPQALSGFWDNLALRVAALPGVQSAGISLARPPREFPFSNNQNLVDKPTPPGETQISVPWNFATPEFFEVLGVRLLQGRMLNDFDSTAALVDETWAQRFYPNENVIGKRFTSGGCTHEQCQQTEVVGIVGDVTYSGVENASEGTVYLNFDVYPNWSAFLIMRTQTDPAAVMSSVRNAVRELDPGVPMSDVATMDELLQDALQAPRYMTLLMGGFAVIALGLAIVGIYGVMTYFVQQHQRDISIRLALGGRPFNVGRMVVLRGMRTVLVGVGAGLVAALGLSRYMRALLFEVAPSDPITIGAVCLMVVGVALLVCVIPARRASGTDPAVMLRADG